MNQSILFPDLQHWDDTRQSVQFVAQAQGMNIHCYISSAKLAELSGAAIQNEGEAMAAFDELRFDLEDSAEALIEAEAFDEHGAIQLG